MHARTTAISRTHEQIRAYTDPLTHTHSHPISIPISLFSRCPQPAYTVWAIIGVVICALVSARLPIDETSIISLRL